MKKPSSNQLSAITHIRGPAELIAGPGSGKTFTIVERIIHLISDCGIKPDSILTVTFSKASTLEMKNRFIKEAGDKDVCFCTFHSLAFNILRESATFSEKSLLSPAEKRNILMQCFKNKGHADKVSGEILMRILEQVSKLKNCGTAESYILKSENSDISDSELNAVMEDYFAFLNEIKKLDFDDMIIKALKLLRENETVLNKYRERFKFILVDEFQDINLPQYELLKLIASPLNNVFIVGDDDQSIYGFRGSAPGIMKDFLSDFNAKQLFLTDNFRSGKNIVLLADKIIKQNKDRFNKEFKPVKDGGHTSFKLFESRKEEEDEVLRLLKALPKESINDCALIVRTNREAALYERLLKRGNIHLKSFIKKEKSVTESFIFDDICAYLSFVYNDRKRSDFIKFMNKPQRYLRQAALINERISFNELKAYYKSNNEMLNLIANMEKQTALSAKMSAKYAISIFRRSFGYDNYLKSIARSKDELSEYLRISQEIEDSFINYNGLSALDDFIRDMERALDKNKNDELKAVEGVSVITMHAAKGLEFDTVILPDINEGVIPTKGLSDDETEEERRLFYVAVTRAKNTLYILATRERNRDISRFIKGIAPYSQL